MDGIIPKESNFALPKGFIVFISGVPGVGKTTISYELLKMFSAFRIIEETDLIREVLRGYNEYIENAFKERVKFLFMAKSLVRTELAGKLIQQMHESTDNDEGIDDMFGNLDMWNP